MEWINGTSKFEEDRNKLKETNDCTVTAWANVFDCDYSKAHSYLAKYGRKKRQGMLRENIKKALEDCKKAKIKFGPYGKTERICVSKFCKQHNKGRYYVVVRGHAFAIKDGVVYDYKYGPRRQITFACRVYLEGELIG